MVICHFLEWAVYLSPVVQLLHDAAAIAQLYVSAIHEGRAKTSCPCPVANTSSSTAMSAEASDSNGHTNGITEGTLRAALCIPRTLADRVCMRVQMKPLCMTARSDYGV